MLSSCKRIFALLFVAVFFVAATPDSEKLPVDASAPLEILSATPSHVFVLTHGDFANRYAFAVNGNDLNIIDLMTWDLTTTQPDGFSDSIVGIGVLANGTSLVVALSNGNLARIELDDTDTFADTDTSEDTSDETVTDDDEPVDSREINVRELLDTNNFSGMAVDPDTSNEIVYLISEEAGNYYEYNLFNGAIRIVTLTRSAGEGLDTETTTSNHSPTAIEVAHSSASVNVVIATSEATLLTLETGSSTFTETPLVPDELITTSPNFDHLEASSDGEFVFAIDGNESMVWVFDVSSAAFLDQTSTGTSLDPIAFDTSTENNSLVDLSIFVDDETAEDILFVAGNEGLSLIDMDSPDSKSDNKIIDPDESTDDAEATVLSATPSLIASTGDGYFLSFNNDTSISVLTENPWVTVSSSSTDRLTETNTTFTLTFQSDSAGTYDVMIDADPAASSGTTLLADQTLDAADTATTTSEIDMADFDRNVFEEGENLITIFITDTNGRIGRDSVLITVDRPPGAVESGTLNFGNKKAYASFTPLSDNDIDFYRIIAVPAEDASSPDCPGSLSFSESSRITLDVDGESCTEASGTCEAEVTGLANDTPYCIAIQATDLSGQVGTIGTFSESVTPEATVGPAGFLGETGCQLSRGSADGNFRWMVVIVMVGIIFFRNRIVRVTSRSPLRILFIINIISSLYLCAVPSTSFAQVPSPAAPASIAPGYFTFEVRGGIWLPTNSDVRSFFAPCCLPTGEIEFGYLFLRNYHVSLTSGFGYAGGDAVGAGSGLASGDSFTLITVPVRLDFAYRFEFVPEQIVVPYLRVGGDFVYFRESSDSGVIQGNKFGVHGGGGIAILLDRLDATGGLGDGANGVDNVYLTLEGRYAYINSFSSTGLDLSGIYPTLGVMFQF